MKKTRILALLMAMVLMTCIFCSCHKAEEDAEVSEVSDNIPVSEDWEMTVGDSKVWIPFDEAEQDVIFRNSDIRFIDLRAGKSTAEIIAIAAGESTLTADWGEKHYRIHVVVNEPVKDKEVSVIEYYDEEGNKYEDRVPG